MRRRIYGTIKQSTIDLAATVATRMFSLLTPFFLGAILSYILLPTPAQSFKHHETLVMVKDVQNEKTLIYGTIVREALKQGVDVSDALSVLTCESHLNPRAKNKTSTAYGIAQFTDPTWAYIDGKNRYDYEEQIIQFMIHYKKHPEWWECKAY